MNVPLVAAASLAALLVSAKTHGRHVRLERELAGVMHIEDFRAGYAHPVVGPLWARDRKRYWTIAPAAALALAPAAGGLAGWPLAVVAALLWAPTVAFLACGAWSLAAWARGVRATTGVDPAWLDAARRGTIAWWGATGTAAMLVVAVAVWT